VSTQQTSPSQRARRPLEGLTIVELGHSVAAPYAGLILADLGARVIKVENPAGGDYARGWGPPFWKDTATVFVCLNRGKASIAVDFSDPADAGALRQLILREADGVIQNLRPGILDKFGLTADAMRAEKPSLIWCDIGAFGARGPLASKPGYDPLAQASTGIMSVTGEGDRPPVRVGVSLIDMGAGMWTVIGLLASLIERGSHGNGAQVSTSLYETGLAWMTVPLAGYECAGEVRKPYGSGTAEIVPYQAFKARNGWLMIAAGNDGLFRRLCLAVGLDDLVDMAQYATNAARVANRDSLIARITAAVGERDVAELGQILDAAGVPNAPLLSIDQVASHPQTEALGMLAPAISGGPRLVGMPLSFDGARPRAEGGPPRLGADDARFAIPSRRDARAHRV
jgi:crotonobetainyl-CoA:carnitine CoA-transferase CaiB-like acyl-CoA transferase